jgi:capsular polysaccharide biosynthesis protein
LIDYGRILLRRGWIIILLAALAGVSAYVFSGTQTPIYRATQLVLIQPSRNDLGLAEATIRLINSYVVYLNSTEIAQQVIDDLRLDLTAGALKGAATIVPDRDRLTVQIDVDLSDPDVAGRAAEAWGNMLVAYRNRENQTVRQEDRINALLPDSPQIGLLRPNRGVTTAVGALLGIVVGGVIVFALEYLESGIVRRREDIEKLDIALLASIPGGK